MILCISANAGASHSSVLSLVIDRPDRSVKFTRYGGSVTIRSMDSAGIDGITERQSPRIIRPIARSIESDGLSSTDGCGCWCCSALAGGVSKDRVKGRGINGQAARARFMPRKPLKASPGLRQCLRRPGDAGPYAADTERGSRAAEQIRHLFEPRYAASTRDGKRRGGRRERRRSPKSVAPVSRGDSPAGLRALAVPWSASPSRPPLYVAKKNPPRRVS